MVSNGRRRPSFSISVTFCHIRFWTFALYGPLALPRRRHIHTSCGANTRHLLEKSRDKPVAPCGPWIAPCGSIQSSISAGREASPALQCHTLRPMRRGLIHWTASQGWSGVARATNSDGSRPAVSRRAGRDMCSLRKGAEPPPVTCGPQSDVRESSIGWSAEIELPRREGVRSRYESVLQTRVPRWRFTDPHVLRNEDRRIVVIHNDCAIMYAVRRWPN